eukprot:1138177-Pelagomonas_calceolata.AAC.3
MKERLQMITAKVCMESGQVCMESGYSIPVRSCDCADHSCKFQRWLFLRLPTRAVESEKSLESGMTLVEHASWWIIGSAQAIRDAPAKKATSA